MYILFVLESKNFTMKWSFCLFVSKTNKKQSGPPSQWVPRIHSKTKAGCVSPRAVPWALHLWCLGQPNSVWGLDMELSSSDLPFRLYLLFFLLSVLSGLPPSFPPLPLPLPFPFLCPSFFFSLIPPSWTSWKILQLLILGSPGFLHFSQPTIFYKKSEVLRKLSCGPSVLTGISPSRAPFRNITRALHVPNVLCAHSPSPWRLPFTLPGQHVLSAVGTPLGSPRSSAKTWPLWALLQPTFYPTQNNSSTVPP